MYNTAITFEVCTSCFVSNCLYFHLRHEVVILCVGHEAFGNIGSRKCLFVLTIARTPPTFRFAPYPKVDSK